MDRLSGKIAVVTGGASGIGAATVRSLTRHGASVISTDVQTDLGEAVASEYGATFVAHDVSNPDSWKNIERIVKEKFGRLDILFNNAGISPLMNIEEIDLERWNRTIGINLTGIMLGCQMAIRLMKQNPGGSSGSIINTASTSAFMAMALDAAYTASKGGVLSLTKAVAVHCARGLNIRCNALVPGSTRTGMTKPYMDSSEEAARALEGMSPLGRMADPAELAAMVVFLASDESSYCTGAEFIVDGGLLAAHPGT